MRIFMIAVLALAAASSAFGSLVSLGPAPEGGTGLGNQLTVLTLQSPGNSTLETGCVGPGESTTDCGFEDNTVKTGAGQVNSFTVGDPDLGLTSLGDLRIIFNVADPGSSPGVIVNALVLTLYKGEDSVSFGLADPVGIESEFLGVGSAGWLFGLDDEQAAIAGVFVNGDPSVVIGLGASVGCEGEDCVGAATGGIDTFYISAVPGQQEPIVPEPSTYLMLLGGVAAIVGGRKLRG